VRANDACDDGIMKAAADLLESQQARITELEGITFWAQNRFLKEQNAELEAQLAESQRRERAAETAEDKAAQAGEEQSDEK